MSDFSTLLRGYVTEQTDRAASGSADRTGQVRAVAWQARRRRRTRAGAVAAAAAAVVLVASAGVFAANRPDPVPPAETHTPTLTPTPTRSPTAEEPQEPAVDPAAAVNPLLPDSQPLEPGMLAAAAVGSFLVDYAVGCGYPCLQAASDPVLYLVNPGGGVYAATSPHPAGMLRDWMPGTSVGLFTHWVGTDGEVGIAVDIDTGRTLGELALPDGMGELTDAGHLLRRTWDWSGQTGVLRLERVALADGTVAASVELPATSSQELSPDRSRVLVTSSSGVRVLDTATLTQVTMPDVAGWYGQPCTGIGWVGPDAIVSCPDPAGTAVLRVPLGGGSPTQVGVHPYGYPYELRDVWQVDGAVVLAPSSVAGDVWAGPEMAGAPTDLRFTVSRGGGLFANTVIDWDATDWGRDYAVDYWGGTPRGVLASAAPHGSDGQSLVLIDPVTGAATTVLVPTSPGWGQVHGVVVAYTEGGK